jgi:hypothetical protein
LFSLLFGQSVRGAISAKETYDDVHKSAATTMGRMTVVRARGCFLHAAEHHFLRRVKRNASADQNTPRPKAPQSFEL